MWWRPRQAEIPIDRIAPLYSVYPFIEEEPLPEERRQSRPARPDRTGSRQSNPYPDATLPDTVRQSFLLEKDRQKYATYTEHRLKTYVRPPLGLMLDRRA